MKSKKNYNFPLDDFIDFSLYDKKFGYYMKKIPFGQKGDFITAPNVSRLFSEMIAIWIISFWESLGSPKKFNLIELGAGNAEMMKILIESFKKFPNFFNSCNIFIYEKSPKLIKIQKNKLNKKKVTWISKINKIKKSPSIFIANEFFDSIPIKQFIKKKNLWCERYVSLEDKYYSFFLKSKFNMQKFEKKINFRLSKNQNFIEYSILATNYLKNITSMIKKYNGGVLIIDYGYFNEKMKDTLQAIHNHKYANVLENIGNSDISHSINFNLYGKIINQLGDLTYLLTNQKKFLLKMGIKERAEIISKNQNFLKKADIYYRLKRLIDDKQMGNLFKVMLIKNKKNKFKLGF
ncbi:SAM-dependent methyltransferase [Pelagibacterales bacterium SAG-MED13]|nr:SAM-dependent methyltransferase [Pelagibacterales bacterium SAG-MED13]